MTDKKIMQKGVFDFIAYAIVVYIVFGTDWYIDRMYPQLDSDPNIIMDIWVSYLFIMGFKFIYYILGQMAAK